MSAPDGSAVAGAELETEFEHGFLNARRFDGIIPEFAGMTLAR